MAKKRQRPCVTDDQKWDGRKSAMRPIGNKYDDPAERDKIIDVLYWCGNISKACEELKIHRRQFDKIRMKFLDFDRAVIDACGSYNTAQIEYMIGQLMPHTMSLLNEKWLKDDDGNLVLDSDGNPISTMDPNDIVRTVSAIEKLKTPPQKTPEPLMQQNIIANDEATIQQVDLSKVGVDRLRQMKRWMDEAAKTEDGLPDVDPESDLDSWNDEVINHDGETVILEERFKSDNGDDDYAASADAFDEVEIIDE